MTTTSKDLPEVAKIEERGGWNFTIALHVEFQSEQYALVSAFDQAKLKFPAGLMDIWNGRLSREVKVNKTVKESAFVSKLNELDKQRDKVLSNIFAIVRGQKLSPKETIADAATDLMRILKPYLHIQKISFDEESACIRALKEDVSTRTDDIATLGLTDSFTELFALNESFVTLRLQRQVESPREDLPNSRVARAETSEAYDVVCCYIEAAFLHAVMANTAIATAGDVKAMARAFALAIQAGRLAYLSGLGGISESARASSPLTGFLE